jgi:hypothetical protein
VTRRLGDGNRVILRQTVRGSVRAVRAVRNTRLFQTETRVVADEPEHKLDVLVQEPNDGREARRPGASESGI